MPDKQENTTTSFLFGLVIGAIVGAVVAIVIYKNNSSEVLDKLKLHLRDFFQDLLKDGQIPSNSIKPKTKKKRSAPMVIAASIPSPSPKRPAPKKFIVSSK